MSAGEIFDANRQPFRTWTRRRYGMVLGSIMDYFTGKQKLEKLSEEVVLREVRMEDNEHFRKHGRYKLGPI